MKIVTYNGVSGLLMTMTLKRQWFNRILEGKKHIEYRDGTEYWISRFSNGKIPKFIRFANGYGATVPAFTIEVIGIKAMCKNLGFEVAEDADTFEKDFTSGTVALDSREYEVRAPRWFEIKLGRIVSKENISRKEKNGTSD